MGGGDLNLKKSWHPSTLKNIERVWKAEQKHEAEQKKIEQLQRELADERARLEIRTYAEDQGVVRKREERLDWMYQGPSALVNRDDYLLGRSVDKTFEILQQAEAGGSGSQNDGDNIPGSIFHEGSHQAPVEAVDLQTKIREDPLFMIRKQEEENRKRLLNNPIRLKQLKDLLKQQMDKKDKTRNKKCKKHKHRSNGIDSENSDIERDRKKQSHRQYHSKQSRHVSEHENHSSSSFTIRDRDNHDDDSKSKCRDEDRSHAHRQRNYGPTSEDFQERETRHTRSSGGRNGNDLNGESEQYSKQRHVYDSSSDEEKSRRKKTYGLVDRAGRKIVSDSYKAPKLGRYSRSRSRSPNSTAVRSSLKIQSSKESSKSRRPRSKSPSRPKLGRYSRSRSCSPNISDVRSSLRHQSSKESSRTMISKSPSPPRQRQQKKKLTAEELQQRREEMMENARWRDEQRSHKVHKYREEAKKEHAELAKPTRSSSENFIRPLLAKAISSSTVEGRIKSNMYNIQRSRGNMEANFLRR